MMQIAKPEIIAVTLSYINLSDRSAPSLNFAIRLSYAPTDHNQRPAVKPDIAATVDCLTDITTINHEVANRAP